MGGKLQPHHRYYSQKKGMAAGICGGGLLLSISALSHAVELSLQTDEQIQFGSSLEVNLVVSDLGNASVGAFDLNVSFDPDLLSVQNVDFGDPALGDLLDPAGAGNFFGSEASGAGAVNLFELSVNDPALLEGAQPDSFVLASISFDTLSVGTTSLNIENVLLGDAQGDPLSADIVNASTTIIGGTLEKVSGDNQSASPSIGGVDQLQPLVVRLIDPQGQPLAGVQMSWSVTPADGAGLQDSATVTGPDGQTQNRLVALNQVGTVTITATAPGAGSVEFTLTGSLSADPGLDEAGRSVAGALDDSCAALRQKQAQGESLSAGEQDLLSTCTVLESGTVTARDVVKQLAPEEVATQGTVMVEISTAHLRNIGVRLLELHTGASGFSTSGLALNLDGQVLPGAVFSGMVPAGLRGGAAGSDEASPFSRLGGFINGTASFGDKDETSREPGFDFDSKGVTAGVDYRFRDDFVLGGAFSYSSINADQDNAGGSLDTDAYSLSLYATYFKEKWYLDGIFSYGRYDYDARRRIVFTGVDQTALSEPEADEFSIGLGGGYDFQRGSLTFGPYARFEYIEANVDSYRERPDDPGAPGAGLVLAIDDQTIQSLTTTLGGQALYAISTSYGVVAPQLRLDWQHQFQDDARRISARFINDPASSTFGIPTDDPDRNYFILGAGVSAQFAEGKAGYIYYETSLGREDVTQHSFAAGLRIEF